MAINNREVQVNKDNHQSAFLSTLPDMDRMFDNRVERFFGTRFSPLMGNWPDLGRRSMVNVQEDEQHYILSAEIPGIPQEEIDINVNGNILTIRAEHREESRAEKNDQSYRRQFRSFQQSFTLPNTVNPDHIEAHYQYGVLDILLPKTEQAKPKKIEIQTSRGGVLNRLLGKKDTQNTQPESDVQH